VLSPLPRYASLVPDVKTTHTKYEWVYNNYESYAGIFRYPHSVAEIGEIAGDGGQGCTNVLYGYGKRIMWNMGGPSQITEYRAPSTPIKTLTDPAGSPSSCAINPTTGDLAVGILDGADSGGVVIYKKASDPGKVITSPLSEEFFDGYDAKGNLFADGFISQFGFVELPAGSSTFRTITLPNGVLFPGSVQWDGKYVTVFDQEANTTYQYTIKGTTATLAGSVKYSGSSDCAQTWIVKGLIYCGDAGTNGGEVFKYPAGGSAVGVFTGNFDTPLGVTAAEK
jgi:hypothetical protein